MKKILCLIFVLLVIIPFNVKANENKVNVYLFYGDGCPHCALLDKYLNKRDDVNIYKYEVWNNEDNEKILDDVSNLLNNPTEKVPYLVIGNTSIIGYDENTSPSRIDDIINYYKKNNYEDKVGVYLGLVSKETENADINNNIKEFTKNSSIIASSLLLGASNGLNITSIMIILLLSILLFSIKNKHKKILMGVSFLLIQSITYYLLLTSKINIEFFVDKIIYVRFLSLFLLIILAYIIISKLNKNNILYTIILLLLGVTLSIISYYYFPKLFIAFREINNTKEIHNIIYILTSFMVNMLIFILFTSILKLKKISSLIENKYNIISFIIIIINFILIYFINKIS